MADRTDGLKPEDAVNQTCPWSGDPVSADSLTLYKGRVVGFFVGLSEFVGDVVIGEVDGDIVVGDIDGAVVIGATVG